MIIGISLFKELTQDTANVSESLDKGSVEELIKKAESPTNVEEKSENHAAVCDPCAGFALEDDADEMQDYKSSNLHVFDQFTSDCDLGNIFSNDEINEEHNDVEKSDTIKGGSETLNEILNDVTDELQDIVHELKHALLYDIDSLLKQPSTTCADLIQGPLNTEESIVDELDESSQKPTEDNISEQIEVDKFAERRKEYLAKLEQLQREKSFLKMQARRSNDLISCLIKPSNFDQNDIASGNIKLKDIAEEEKKSDATNVSGANLPNSN